MDQPNDYPHPVDGSIELHETHISRVYLAGSLAYKLKKEIKTAFLDYSTLSLRQKACEEELRLGNRYAKDLYIRVVPITRDEDRLVVDGHGPIVDYAVQMHRFANDAILSQRLEKKLVTSDDIVEITRTTSKFHREAEIVHGDFDSFQEKTLEFAIDNFDVIQSQPHPDIEREMDLLRDWTRQEWARLLEKSHDRYRAGKVRECHGDLHCGNIVHWAGRWVLFDGIEFNTDLTRIDVIYDAAFLMMDLQARGRRDLANVWINAYIEATGDHDALKVLRWYLVYLAMVRAKVAALREYQLDGDRQAKRVSRAEVARYTRLAHEFATASQSTELWITHGLSGSGKSTESLRVIQSLGAMRVRSDIERNRMFGSGHYDATATQATYQRLLELAEIILDAGYKAIVDATFLKHDQRALFHKLAQRKGIPFRILDCRADLTTLRTRIEKRLAQGQDPSEANPGVLEKQLQAYEPLDDSELSYAVPKEQLL
jgi:aminoglycoside phosphotransferase family enzyme/predicted kinase